MNKSDADKLAKADEIEALIAQGLTHRQIAKKLNIAPSTVDRRKRAGRLIRSSVDSSVTPTTVERR